METLRHFFSAAYAPLKLAGKLSTRRQYEIQFKHFERFLGREPTLNDLDDDLVAAFLGSMIEKGRSPATVNKARNHLLAVWRYAARKGIIKLYPDVAAWREPERAPRAWSTEQLSGLFKACAEEPGIICGIPAGKWWLALHCVFWDSGERKSAILDLRWEHVDLRRSWLIIPAELRKGKTRDNTIRLHPRTVERLKEIRMPRRDLIFPWDKHRQYIYVFYKNILERAGLPTDRKSMFHRMRKSVASHFEAAGGNATALLDHSSRKTTMAYLDPTIVGEQHAADVLFRPD